MPFHYEALVGYLYVVGGRAVSVAPPGALVEVAPLRAARGREADTYFALVLPSGDSLAPTAFYQQMANFSAERYFDSTGSVSAGLRDTLATLNQNLLDHNQNNNNRTYEAAMLCAVLRGDDLIVARVGAATGALLHEGVLQTIPADLDNDEVLYTPPLGVGSAPDVRLSRHKVATGSRLILTDSNMADFTREQIERAIRLPDIGEVLVGFKELARLQLTLVAVEFVPPEVSAPIPVPEGESTAAIAEAARALAARARASTTTVQDSNGSATDKRGERLNRRAGRATSRLAQEAQRGLGVAAQSTARGLQVTGQAVEHFFGPPPEGKRRWYASPAATAVAVLIPVVIVGVVVALWLGGTGQSEYEICLEAAGTLRESAEATPSDNPASLVSLWTAVINAARDCETLRPDDPDSLAMIRQGQAIIDEINLVERREALILDTVDGAVLSQVMLQSPNIYVLDKVNRKRVYQGVLADDGLRLERALNPIANMTTGATVSGAVVGDLLAIGYNQNADALYALDANGALIQCRRAQMQACELQFLLNYEAWVSPIAIRFFSDRLYILDPGANQIWRYDSSGNGVYSARTPGLYFDGQNLGNVTRAVDFAIDSPPSGNVYTLLADGTILMYNSGEPQEFRYAGFPEGQPLNSAQALVLDESPTVRAFFVANRDGAIIHEVGMGGSFRTGYKVFDDAMFATLSGVASNPTREVLYVTSGNALLALQRRE